MKLYYAGLNRTQEKPLGAMATVDVFIPAFNEGSCIGNILQDVTRAKTGDWFEIKNIYVISDASTDKTSYCVKNFTVKDQRVKLVEKQYRKGKQDSLNLAFTLTDADIIVFIDADVRLANEDSLAKLLRHFHDGKIALVQGGFVRCLSSFTLSPAKQAGYFDWILVDKIRRKKPISWWSIDGRVMALCRDFYKRLILPLSQADDQFIFYSCIQQGRRFVWAYDAIFYYGPPESIGDFSHQWSRYFFYTKQSREYFGKDLIDEDMGVPGLLRTILSTFIHHPFSGTMWVLCYAISRIEFMLRFDFKKYKRGLFWTESKPIINIEQWHITDEDSSLLSAEKVINKSGMLKKD